MRHCTSSWLFDVWDGAAVALFWLVATPVALLAVRHHQRVQLREWGAIRDARPHVLGAGWFIAACVVFGAIGGAAGEPAFVHYGPLLGIVGAYAYIAWRDHSVSFAAGTVVVTAVMGAFVLLVDDPAWIFALAMSGNLVFDGFAERNRGPA